MAATPARAAFAGRNGRIVFEHFTSSSPSQITSVTARGRHARVLTDYRREAVAPDVSPRGGRIAFTLIGSRRVPDKVITMRSGGANAHAITHGCTGRCLGDGEPAWSPDGRQLVFNRAFGPIVKDNADHIDLMIMNRNGTHLRTLIHDAGNGKRRDFEAGGWSWSPDGTQLAGTFAGPQQPEPGVGDLHRRPRLARHAPHHPLAAERRQPRLLARRAADRLQLRLGGADALEPVHDQPRGHQHAPAQPPAARTTRSGPSSAPRATRSSTWSPAGTRPSTWRGGRSAARCASGSPATPCAASIRPGRARP